MARPKALRVLSNLIDRVSEPTTAEDTMLHLDPTKTKIHQDP